MRTLSAPAVVSINEQETDEVWLTLLTVTHASLATPLRFVNNTMAVTSRGNVYLAFPFEIEFPGMDDENAGEARIEIDNVDRSIVIALRQMDDPPKITLEVVLASSLDTVEAEFGNLVLRNCTYDKERVTGVLRYEDIVVEPVTVAMTPQRFPGMF